MVEAGGWNRKMTFRLELDWIDLVLWIQSKWIMVNWYQKTGGGALKHPEQLTPKGSPKSVILKCYYCVSTNVIYLFIRRDQNCREFCSIFSRESNERTNADNWVPHRLDLYWKSYRMSKLVFIGICWVKFEDKVKEKRKLCINRKQWQNISFNAFHSESLCKCGKRTIEVRQRAIAVNDHLFSAPILLVDAIPLIIWLKRLKRLTDSNQSCVARTFSEAFCVSFFYSETMSSLVFHSDSGLSPILVFQGSINTFGFRIYNLLKHNS